MFRGPFPDRTGEPRRTLPVGLRLDRGPMGSAMGRGVPAIRRARGRVPAVALAVCRAAHAVALRRDGGPDVVLTDLPQCVLEPVRFRLVVGDSHPPFVEPAAGLVPVENDAERGATTERDLDEAALGDRLDRVEEANMGLVVASEQ